MSDRRISLSYKIPYVIEVLSISGSMTNALYGPELGGEKMSRILSPGLAAVGGTGSHRVDSDTKAAKKHNAPSISSIPHTITYLLSCRLGERNAGALHDAMNLPGPEAVADFQSNT